MRLLFHPLALQAHYRVRVVLRHQAVLHPRAKAVHRLFHLAQVHFHRVRLNRVLHLPCRLFQRHHAAVVHQAQTGVVNELSISLNIFV